MEIDDDTKYAIIIIITIIFLMLVFYIGINMLDRYKNKNIKHIEEINNKVYDEEDTVVELNIR